MKQFLRFFVPLMWGILLLFSLSYLFDMLNTSNTIENTLGLVGICLVIYLSVVLRLGLKLLTKKNKEKV